MVSAILDSGDTPHVGMLINPLSGKNRRDTAAISEIVKAYPQILRKEVQTPRDIYEGLIDFGRRKVSLLIISGGDGTVQAVLTILFHHQPFAVLPRLMVLEGGTTNMIAGDVGITGNQGRALRRLFHWLQTGTGSITSLQRPVIRLLISGHEAKYGMFFGAAGISRGIQYYRRTIHDGRLRGLPGICLTLIRFIWGTIRQHNQFAGSTHMVVSVNGQRLRNEEFMLVFVTTLDRLFFGLRPFWAVEQGLLRFTAVSTRARYFPWILPFLAKGGKGPKSTGESGYYSHNAYEIELCSAESVALDGEIYTPSSKEKPTLLQYGGTVTFLRV